MLLAKYIKVKRKLKFANKHYSLLKTILLNILKIEKTCSYKILASPKELIVL
jgi:hypothetical protein